MKKIDMSEINQLKIDLRNKTSMYENQKKLNNELKDEIKILKAENKKLTLLVEELLNKFKQQEWIINKLNIKIEKLNKTSENSSKSPSTDIVKKNKSLRWKTDNKSWWQKWHDWCCEKQSDNPDEIIECKPERCSICWKEFDSNTKFKILWKKQKIDISKIIKLITEYRLMWAKCTCWHKGKWEYPNDIKAPVQYWTNLQSFVGYLSVAHSIPQKRITNILKDLLSIELSSWTIDNILSKTKDKIYDYTNEIMRIIKTNHWVWSDETWTRVQKQNWYCWTWQNDLWSYYFSKKSRAYQVIYDIFRENYNWTMLHDCFSAQNNTVANDHQLCHPHLLRDLIFCLELENSSWAFNMIHLLLKSEKAREVIWKDWFDEEKRKNIQKYYVDCLENMLEEIPKTKETLRMYKRFKKHKMMIFTFMKYKDVPHHNNSSEQAIRSHKIKKKVSGCFRSEEWISRHDTILSFIETMKKQNRDILKSLKQAIEWKFYFCLN